MDATCAICLESLLQHTATTECGHTFHTRCLCSFTAGGNVACPLCRHPFCKRPERHEDDSEHRTVLQILTIGDLSPVLQRARRARLLDLTQATADDRSLLERYRDARVEVDVLPAPQRRVERRWRARDDAGDSQEAPT